MFYSRKQGRAVLFLKKARPGGTFPQESKAEQPIPNAKRGPGPPAAEESQSPGTPQKRVKVGP